MHPCSDADIKATVDLVVEYLENRYRYSKKDFPRLLGLDDESRPTEERDDKKSGRKTINTKLGSPPTEDRQDSKSSSKTINAKLGPSPSPRKKQKLLKPEFRKEEEEE